MLIVTLHNLGIDPAVPPDDQICNYDVEVLITRTPTDLVPIARGRIEGHRRGDGWRTLLERVAKELP